MDINYKEFLHHLEKQNKVREVAKDQNLFSWGSDKLPAADAFKAMMRQDDPCDFCGRNDTAVPYMYVKDEDEVICMPCLEQESWKRKKQ